jgi:hypothetical protein
MPPAVTSLFVAWQSPAPEGSWFTVGKLSSNEGRYRYEYTKGVESAAIAGFRPFAAFPDPFVTYESERLFPFFENRLLSKSRREYSEFVRWVSGHGDNVDPVLLLGQSGGHRMTDSLELFPKPERDERGFFHLHFFVHGLRHMPPSAALRAKELQRGDELLVVKDVQNPFDHLALMLRTPGTREQDIHFLGYVPRYLAAEIARWVEGSQFGPVRVLRTNPPPAPIQYRILCCLEFHPPDRERLFESEEFTPMSVGLRQARPALSRSLGKR